MLKLHLSGLGASPVEAVWERKDLPLAPNEGQTHPQAVQPVSELVQVEQEADY